MEKRYRRLTDLIELTGMLQQTYCGITVEQIAEHFDVSRRTAERMLGVLRDVYPDLETQVREGHKYWRLQVGAACTEPRLEASIGPGDRHVDELDERVLAEQVLAESPVGMLLLDRDCSVVWANEAVELFFGVDKEKLVGRNKREILKAVTRDCLFEPDDFIDRVIESYEEESSVEQLLAHVKPGANRQERVLEYWSRRVTDGPHAGGRVEHYLDVSHSHLDQVRIDRSHRVIARARLVAKMIVDLETGQRGYLIAGRPEFLEPYQAAKERLADNFDGLKSLVRDDAKQSERLEHLEKLLAEWHRRSAEPEIEIRSRVAETLRNEEPLSVLLEERLGGRILERVRQTLRDLQAEFECECICGRLPNSQHIALAARGEVAEMESAQRGFLVFGEDVFVEQFTTARAALAIHLEELEKASPEEHLDRIRLVGALCDRWVEQAAIPEMEARRHRDQAGPTMEDVTHIIQSGVGKGLMDRMRRVLYSFQAHEQNLLADLADLADPAEQRASEGLGVDHQPDEPSL